MSTVSEEDEEVELHPLVLTEEQRRMQQEFEDEDLNWGSHIESMEEMLNSSTTITERGELEAMSIAIEVSETELKGSLIKLQGLLEREMYIQYKRRFEDNKRKMTLLRSRIEVSRNIPLQSQNNTTLNTGFNQTSSFSKKNSVKLPKLNLPHFDGNPLEYHGFLDRFNASVDSNEDLSDVEKLQYLKGICKGEAEGVIKSFPMTNEAYQLAKNELKDHFGSLVTQKNALMKGIRDLKSIFELYPVKPVKALLTSISSHVRTLEHLSVPVRTSGLFLIPDIIQKFPPEISQRYYQIHSEEDENVITMIDFISKELRIAEKSEVTVLMKRGNVKKSEAKIEKKESSPETPKGSMASCATSNSGNSENSNKKENSNQAESQSKKLSCAFCQGAHFHSNCEKIVDPKERYEAVKKKHLCFNCLRSTHGVKDCPIKFFCRKCGSRHHTSLCRKEKEAVSAKKEEVKKETPTVSANVSLTVASSIQLMIFSVYLVPKNEEEKILIRGLLDPGSHRSYITKSLVDRLKLRSKGQICTNTQCLSDPVPVKKTYDIFEVVIQSRHKPNSLTCKVLQADSLPDISGIPDNQFIEKIQEFGLPMAEIHPSNSKKIDILLGGDYWWRIFLAGRKRINKDVGMIKTIFGWIINGVTGNTKEVDENASCINVSCHISDTQLENMWSLDAIGINSGEKSTDFVRDRFEENSTRLEDGRYQVELPFNEHIGGLKSNWANALNQLAGTLKKIDVNEDYKTRYDNAMNEYLSQNHAEVVPTEEIDAKRVYYIPHHPVIREDRDTTKFRVVFNASSAKKGEKSLNECLYPGPSLNPDLLLILIRFRLFKVPVIADIKQAFLQVSIKKEHRDVMRFLWVKKKYFENSFSWSNLWNNLMIIRMSVVAFGINSSPFLLCAAIRQQAKTYIEKYPKEVESLNNSIYMDDLTSGGDKQEDTVDHCKKLKYILDEAKMPLVKWATSDESVFKSLKEAGFHMRQENYDDLKEIKMLGVQWSSKDDKINYKTVMEDARILTKRDILSIVASLFDPMGLLAPVILPMKLLLQKLWQQDLKWDDEVPDEFQKEVSIWKKEIQKLADLNIERWMGTYTKRKLKLEIFCDASPQAYGCVVYTVTEDGIRRLLLSKNRIAPIKILTLPRLELTAAVIGARIADYVVKNQSNEFPITDVTFYSDSMITLSWIKSGKNIWKPYISNRIYEILKLTKAEQWKYVPTKENPADLLTRPMSVKDFLKTEVWWKGIDNPPNIPIENIDAPTEERKIENINLAATSQEILPFLKKYSRLKKLIRVTCYILRWKNKLRGEISPDEMEEVKQRLILLFQKIEFSTEIENLEKKEKIRISSPLKNLDPFIDKKGLLRLRGRLLNAPLVYDEKFPIILHPDSWICRLIIREAHIKLKHGDVSETLYYLRNHYWILRSRRTIKSVIRNCSICRKAKLEKNNPIFGDLPSERVSPAMPFTNVGMDHLGPVYVKEGTNKSRKTYICLFTCLVSRAIHLEVSQDLTTEKFLLAFRRFTARYGYPAKIYTDNSKTFERGNKEINSWGQLLAHKDIQTVFTDQKVIWNFIPPNSPWWGGSWERMVRSVKDKLRKTFTNHLIDLEELQTVVLEISSIINSRPLGYVAETPDGYILSPENLLTGGMPKMLLNKSPSAIRKKDFRKLDKRRRMFIFRFWAHWKESYLKQLRNFHEAKGDSTYENIKPDQVVLLEKVGSNPYFWPIARVLEAKSGDDGIVRVVKVVTADGRKFTRAVKHVRLLELES